MKQLLYEFLAFEQNISLKIIYFAHLLHSVIEDSAHPNLCTLASSVAFAGGTLNVVRELSEFRAQKKKPLVVEGFTIGNQHFKLF